MRRSEDTVSRLMTIAPRAAHSVRFRGDGRRQFSRKAEHRERHRSAAQSHVFPDGVATISCRGLLGHLNWYESYLIAHYEASAAFVHGQRRECEIIQCMGVIGAGRVYDWCAAFWGTYGNRSNPPPENPPFRQSFFPGMAVLILASVIVGFGPTYYWAGVLKAPLPRSTLTSTARCFPVGFFC